MSGLVDLHCHYLPGVDDGVDNLDESLTLLRGLRALGFEQVSDAVVERLGGKKILRPVVDLANASARRQTVGDLLAQGGVPLKLQKVGSNSIGQIDVGHIPVLTPTALVLTVRGGYAPPIRTVHIPCRFSAREVKKRHTCI